MSASKGFNTPGFDRSTLIDQTDIQSVDDIIMQHRDQISNLQLKDANHRKNVDKLKRDNDYLKKQVKAQAK